MLRKKKVIYKNINNVKYGYYQSPIDLIEITVIDEQITSLKFVKNRNYLSSDNYVIKQCISQLNLYFKKELKKFNLPLAISGTAFQKLVWSKTWKIPYGTTISYKELAKQINKPKATRAVGTSLGKNPLAIIIPCHRVISSDQKLVNYHYGLDKKKYLLKLEKVI